MKYLIDSLQSYENGYGDALCPTRVDASKTFLGEGELTRIATLQDIHVLMDAVELASSNKSLSHQHSPTGSGPRVHTLSPFTCRLGPGESLGSYTGIPNTTQTQMMSTTSMAANVSTTSMATNISGWPESASIQGAAVATDSLTTADKRTRSVGLPTAGVFIPNLPRGKRSWLEAVIQWEQGYPEKGIMALKDWPKEHYTGIMKDKVSTKRRNRRLIAEEYQRYVSSNILIHTFHVILFRLGRNEAAFEELYGNATGPAALIKEIRHNVKSLGSGDKSPLPGRSNSEEEHDSPMGGDDSV
jgi:hypothetical protein